MLDYQAIIKSDTATRLLNVFTFEYKSFASLFKGCGVHGGAGVRWTVFEEGTPWERGRPLVEVLKKEDSLPQGSDIYV